jgi:hypothetical protein
MRNFIENLQDLYDNIMADSKKRMAFVAVCSFVIGVMVGSL